MGIIFQSSYVLLATIVLLEALVVISVFKRSASARIRGRKKSLEYARSQNGPLPGEPAPAFRGRRWNQYADFSNSKLIGSQTALLFLSTANPGRYEFADQLHLSQALFSNVERGRKLVVVCSGGPSADIDELENFARSRKMKAFEIIDDSSNSIVNQFHVFEFPCMVLVSRDGIVEKVGVLFDRHLDERDGQVQYSDLGALGRKA